MYSVSTDIASDCIVCWSDVVIPVRAEYAVRSVSDGSDAMLVVSVAVTAFAHEVCFLVFGLLVVLLFVVVVMPGKSSA
jgi:hypothetical protein